MMDETSRRRAVQEAHNEAHGIIPQAATRPIQSLDRDRRVSDAGPDPRVVKHRQSRRGNSGAVHTDQGDLLSFLGAADALPDGGEKAVRDLQAKMKEAAQALRFEEAAALRDQLRALRERTLAFGLED
jgi:excinuclease ABC subunit B